MIKSKTGLIIGSIACLLIILLTLVPDVVYAAPSAGQVTSKFNNGMKVIQGILSGVVVSIGIAVSLFIIIKKMPSADDPHEKNQIYKSIGVVMMLVILAGAIVWLVPFFYGLLT
ncbi:conjugal transfer protein [Listeria booriae]|uniref:CagC family type IV secretion system protein n=1 Tax=Listeria booriae TaxID=1552123 RepID=UPI001623A57F|nr:CagC family type IV secretion system protein [Listeria booriae]MBC2266138.1 conjugal transfer protein [Listeria booriae]